ncbi:MAG: hypothetical protein ACRDTU_00235 [Micromonosporaceae bacterium]
MSRRRRRVTVQKLTVPRLEKAKAAFTTRRVPRNRMRTLVSGTVRPRSGDLVLAAVTRIGQHRKIEQPNGRRAMLHVGDEILVTYADRYAPDQFEAQVPHDLGRAQLVAAGGVAATMLSRSRDVRNATDILPIGLVGDSYGRALNLSDFGLKAVKPDRPRPRTIAIIGTSMNSGKTTTIQHMVHSLSSAGVATGATKVTGTGSGGDYWVMLDAGALRMLDFTDAGLASTYRQPISTVERVVRQLVDHLTHARSDVNFVEVADGVYQRETALLLQSKVFHSLVDAVLFTAADAAGAAAGVAELRRAGLDVVGVTGRLTRSPLAIREAERAVELPVFTRAQLADPKTVCELIGLSPTLLGEDGAESEPWPSSGLDWDVPPDADVDAPDAEVFGAGAEDAGADSAGANRAGANGAGANGAGADASGTDDAERAADEEITEHDDLAAPAAI